MNIKCVTYSRFSTSIPIYTVNQETSNKTITADADKVLLLSSRWHPRSRHSAARRVKEKN